MKRLLPHPVLTPALAVVWLLLNNSLAPGHIVLGLFLGWAIPIFTLPFWPHAVPVRRPRALLRLAGVLLADIVVANLVVARRILGRPETLRPSFVEVRLELQTDLAISLLASTVSLTPGTVSARLSPDRRTLLVHGLNVPDAATLAATIKQRYEAPLKEIFEC